MIILSTLVPVKFWVFLFFVPPDLKCKLKLVYYVSRGKHSDKKYIYRVIPHF